jgi:hypothetical protein
MGRGGIGNYEGTIWWWWWLGQSCPVGGHKDAQDRTWRFMGFQSPSSDRMAINMSLKLFCQALLVLSALGAVVPRAEQCPALPTSYTPKANAKLPDPFLQADGSRITKKDDWTCQRNLLSQLIQKYELGEYPAPPESVTASLSTGPLNSTLAITVEDKGKRISFSVVIKTPSGAGPFPAIIAYEAASFTIPSGIATITFRNDDLAQQSGTVSRGKGKFYDLYGSDATASAMLAWAWGVDRIIDALEQTPSAKIDPKRLAVTGCSRHGKGALVAGAFVERIALTIPQESGAGGSACWRLSDDMARQGKTVQTAKQITRENVWLSKSFEQFVDDVSKLPVDHHQLAALIAPRALLVIENTSMEWLGNMATYGCMKTAHKVWEALGVPENMGFSQNGDHSHCQWPGSQDPELNAFVDKFLKGTGTADTNIVKTDNPSLGFTESDWVDWTVPSLS